MKSISVHQFANATIRIAIANYSNGDDKIVHLNLCWIRIHLSISRSIRGYDHSNWRIVSQTVLKSVLGKKIQNQSVGQFAITIIRIR